MLAVIRNPRARRYILRLRTDGTLRLTIPRGGSPTVARQFAARQAAWLERQFARLAAREVRPTCWRIGSQFLFRGNEVTIEADVDGGGIRFGGECLRVPDSSDDLRQTISKHLLKLAGHELPLRVFELAAQHQLTVSRVTIRNQRSRWGSCSRRATISLNWRLIQVPEFVRDYIILHELMHLRQMNHSAGFWREVERICPGYEIAERWIKEHAALLR
ncbi:MAG: M48 family metallopeptidase [Opitutaceae bacterium]|nr:M48 family metallopeptidase [Verrucomicrobiales bacterium]